MKKRANLLLLLCLWSAAPASAQSFLGRFMDRYRDSRIDAPVLETSVALGPPLLNLGQDGGIPLREGDVIRLALESNLDIGVSRFGPLASEYAIGLAYERFDPTLTFSGTINRSTTPAATQLDGAAVNSRLTGNYAVTYNHLLAPGTSYQVRFQMNRSSTNSAFSTINPSYSGTLTSSFTQPLLRNFGTLVNTSQIRIARNNLELSETQFEQQVMDLVVQVTNTYWDLVAANEAVRVQEGALERALQTYEDNQMQVEIGTLAAIEVVQAEQAVASQRESRIAARYGRTRIEDQLKTMITSVADPAIVLLTLDPIDDIRNLNHEILPVEEAIRLALLNRPELRQARLDAENGEINLQVARNSLLPQLDLTASYTMSGLGGTRFQRTGLGANQVTTAIPGGVGGAFNDIFGFDFTGYSVGFSLQIPLSNRSAQANLAQRTVQQRQTQSRAALTAQQIAFEVRDAYNQIEANQARIEAARVSRELAQRRLEAEQRKRTLGASSVRFVLDEQQNLTAAETTEIQALVDYAKSVVGYDRAIGRTLDRNNIRIEDEPRRQPIARVGAVPE